ncbi:MAG TPA: hypothetical protein VLC28_10445, partial [Flavitalea sp.]|nr:hypothetical protein [Flavitalea sp.]
DAYQAAVNGLNGMVKLQSVFLGMSEILYVGSIVSLSLAALLLVLWIKRNHIMLYNFITFNKTADENLQPGTANT